MSTSFYAAVSTSPAPDLTRRLRTFRLVRPHKVQAVQDRYAAYGDRVEIGPVDDLIKGDFTDVLKGTHTERINGT